MPDLEISELARRMSLGFVRRHWRELVEEAASRGMGHEEFLRRALLSEYECRRSNVIKERLRIAGFPSLLTFDQLDMAAFDPSVAAKIAELRGLDFVREGRNVIMAGNPGVGKTHIATALGVAACQAGFTVLFTSVPNLVIEVRERAKLQEMTTFKRRFCKYDLVILDELGYVSFDKSSSEILFNLLSTRNVSKSIVITTNLEFERWSEVFGDQVLTAAMVDRLTHKSHVLNIQGESYRMKETKAWLNS